MQREDREREEGKKVLKEKPQHEGKMSPKGEGHDKPIGGGVCLELAIPRGGGRWPLLLRFLRGGGGPKEQRLETDRTDVLKENRGKEGLKTRKLR